MNTLQKHFVDTNIFIHTLFAIDTKKQEACISLFEQASRGTYRLWSTEWVIAELVWFLTRQKMKWSSIQLVIEKILVTKGLEIHGATLVQHVLQECADSKHFNDGINIMLARESGISKGFSYDKGIGKWEGFVRVEPNI